MVIISSPLLLFFAASCYRTTRATTVQTRSSTSSSSSSSSSSFFASAERTRGSPFRVKEVLYEDEDSSHHSTSPKKGSRSAEEKKTDGNDINKENTDTTKKKNSGNDHKTDDESSKRNSDNEQAQNDKRENNGEAGVKKEDEVQAKKETEAPLIASPPDQTSDEAISALLLGDALDDKTATSQAEYRDAFKNLETAITHSQDIMRQAGVTANVTNASSVKNLFMAGNMETVITHLQKSALLMEAQQSEFLKNLNENKKLIGGNALDLLTHFDEGSPGHICHEKYLRDITNVERQKLSSAKFFVLHQNRFDSYKKLVILASHYVNKSAALEKSSGNGAMQATLATIAANVATKASTNLNQAQAFLRNATILEAKGFIQQEELNMKMKDCRRTYTVMQMFNKELKKEEEGLGKIGKEENEKAENEFVMADLYDEARHPQTAVTSIKIGFEGDSHATSASHTTAGSDATPAVHATVKKSKTTSNADNSEYVMADIVGEHDQQRGFHQQPKSNTMKITADDYTLEQTITG
eukprot:g1268.t1